jgi:hypothetical protein
MICRIATWLFALAWLAALALLAVGALGLFGQQRDPLSGAFLMPLGLPWNLVLDIFPPEPRFWLAALVPGLNLAIIVALCRMQGWRR